MTLEDITMYAIGVLVLFGAGFMLVGSIGLIRFKDAMTRMHGPTKASTLGVGSLLLGSMIYFGAFSEGGSIHDVLIMAFIFVTAPISANFLSKVAIHHRHCDTPPDLPKEETWATLNAPDDEMQQDAAQTQ